MLSSCRSEATAHGTRRFTSTAAPLTLAGVNDTATADIDAPSNAAMDAVADGPGDESLMLAYAGGDIAAFETLYARHRLRLYRFLQRQLRDRSLADEVFQDVWQRVIAARSSWRPDSGFTSWLYTLARNRIADHWRAQKHRPPAPEDADERLANVADDDTPEQALSTFEQRRQLQMALDELPDDQREVIALRLEQELTLEEIGTITGVGRETVKSRLRYAMDKLRARLGP